MHWCASGAPRTYLPPSRPTTAAAAVDVIKSAMMTDSIDPAQRKYPSIPVAARKLWAEGENAGGT